MLPTKKAKSGGALISISRVLPPFPRSQNQHTYCSNIFMSITHCQVFRNRSRLVGKKSIKNLFTTIAALFLIILGVVVTFYDIC